MNTSEVTMPFPYCSVRARSNPHRARRVFVFVLFLVLFLTPYASQAASQEPSAPKEAEQAEVAFQKGMDALHQRKQPGESIQHFRKAIELRPDYAAAQVELGQAYLKAKQFADAKETLEAAVESSAGNARAHYLLGIAYKRLVEYPKSLAALREAVKLDPKIFDAQYELAFALLRVREVEQAEVHALAAHDLEKDQVKIHLLLYNVAAGRALDLELAERELLHLLELFPEGTSAARARILLEEIRGRLEAQGKRLPDKEAAPPN